MQQGALLGADLQQRVDRLGIRDALRQPAPMGRTDLAALYRTASAVLVTSESEGFGLPVIEALACGAPVVASDIPVLREVGGEACLYCTVADVDAWTEAVIAVVTAGSAPAWVDRSAQAARYTWSAHARTVLDGYRRLLP